MLVCNVSERNIKKRFYPIRAMGAKVALSIGVLREAADGAPPNFNNLGDEPKAAVLAKAEIRQWAIYRMFQTSSSRSGTASVLQFVAKPESSCPIPRQPT